MMDSLTLEPVTADASRESAHLRLLYKVSDMLHDVSADGLDIDVVLPRLLTLAKLELAASSASIFVIDHAQSLQHVWLLREDNASHEKRTTPFLNNVMKSGLAGSAIASQQVIIIDNTLEDSRWKSNPEFQDKPMSAICAPFVIRERPIGTITLTKHGVAQFRPEDRQLLDMLANQAARTIENARLYEEAQRQLRIQALLNVAGKVINSSLDLNEILQSLLNQMNELLNAEALSIALVDPRANELVYEVAEGVGSDKIVGLRLPSNTGVSGWVMEHAEPALVADTRTDERFTQEGDARTRHTTRSMICAPLHAKGNVLGTIQAINPRDGHFTEDDLRLLVSLANLASSAINNAQQFARTQAAEARYVGLFEDSINPIILTDHHGRVVDLNQRAIEFFGYRRHHLLEEPLARLHPDNSAIVEPQQFKLLFESDQIRLVSGQIITSDQRLVPVEVHAKRTKSGDDEVLQWIYHDISKKVELQEMQRDLTAMLFHDLQSPLSNVISSLQLLGLELPEDSPEPVTAMLEVAVNSSQHLQGLIRSLLDIHRLEESNIIVKKAPQDIERLINESLAAVNASLDQRRMGVRRDLPDDLPPVLADADMIRRVLINLLDNAIKFNPAEQLITVAVRRTGARRVIVSVSDQGTGIPKKYQEIIFEKFRRVKSQTRAKGLGLGLAFCRLAVEAHGGRIWVDDAETGGARFNFSLTCDKGAPAAE